MTTTEPHLAYIYALTDPTTGEPRYVGMTRNPEARRMWHHHNRRYDSGNMPLKHWLRSLDVPPGICILDEAPWADRYQREAEWTHCFRWAMKDKLLNMATGIWPDAETRIRMSAAKTPEIRARLSERMKNIWSAKRMTTAA